jgi:hypothetical protein
MFYRDELEQLYQETPRLLYEWNLLCLSWAHKKMKVDIKIDNTIIHKKEEKHTSFIDSYSPQNFNKHKTDISVSYNQVFEDKTGFFPNLSVLDLLFNEGSNSKQVLLNIVNKLPSNTAV